MPDAPGTAAEKRIEALGSLILGRQPDARGQATRLADYSSGLSLREISGHFPDSPESRAVAIGGGLPPVPLHRPRGTPAEVAYRRPMLDLDGGPHALVDVASEFAGSPEFGASTG